MSKAAVMELKFDVGVPSGKLKKPPKSCMPSKAKMKMNRKSRKSRDKMEDMAFISAITRFLSEDQYLKGETNILEKCCINCAKTSWPYLVTLKTRKSLRALSADSPKLPARS